MTTTNNDQRQIDDYKEVILSAFADFSGLDEKELRVGLGGARELLRSGGPLTPTQIARAVDVPIATVESILQRHAEKGFVYFDGEGRIVGMWAVGGMDAGHQLEIEGRSAPTWCALDTLLLPLWWDVAAHVTSRDPFTGTAISFAVSPDGVAGLLPAGAVVSAYEPEGQITREVRMTFCQFVNFFESADSAERWAATQTGRRFRFLPVEVAFGWAKDSVGSIFKNYPAHGVA
jgi:hypothetical protein